MTKLAAQRSRVLFPYLKPKGGSHSLAKLDQSHVLSLSNKTTHRVFKTSKLQNLQNSDLKKKKLKRHKRVMPKA